MSMASSKLYLDNINIGSAKLGTSDVRMFLGEELVYPIGPISLISYDAATYNGTLQTAQNIVVIDNTGNTLVENVDYVVTENNGGINAGKYNLAISLMGQYQGTASTKFVIDKADSSISFNTSDVAVKVGDTKSNQVTVNAGDGAVRYTSSDISIAAVDNINGNIFGSSSGDTIITATINATDNYNSASTTCVVSCEIYDIIAKFNVTDISSPTRISGNYGFSNIEIDGVIQTPVSTYTFSTTGEHTVKYDVSLYDETIIGQSIFSGCSNLTSVNILLNSVTSIGNSAFAGCTSLTSITIPDSVTSIGNGAFANCTSLTSIDIPSGVTTIGHYAFSSCTGLTSVNIPNSVILIDEFAFHYCSGLTSITIPSGVTRINRWAFASCSGLTSITIPDSVTYIANGAFQSCGVLTSITIGSGVTTINGDAFTSCYVTAFINNSSLDEVANNYWGCVIYDTEVDGLLIKGTTAVKYMGSSSSVVIPDSVTSIGSSAFTNCSDLISVSIPDSVTSIGSYAFESCTSLTSVTIPDSVTSIGGYAFRECKSLTSVSIPDSVTSISLGAFVYCSGLTSIISNAMTAPTIYDDTFRDVKTNGTLYVPIGSSGYDTWMSTDYSYLGYSNWTKVEQ